jgi:divalent metal cation (Fe/Co/Zn/Cd) transporter
MHDHYRHAHDQAAERRTLALAKVGFAWHLVEAAAALWLAWIAGSVALLAFGLDSMIELFAGAVIIWRMHPTRAGQIGHRHDEKRAAVMIAWSFYTLAAYVAAHSIYALSSARQPGESAAGIALAVVTVLTMWPLARAKHAAAAKAESASAKSEASQTSLCVWMAIALLGGLGLHSLLGWWWADPISALAIAALALAEGRKVHRSGQIDCC